MKVDISEGLALYGNRARHVFQNPIAKLWRWHQAEISSFLLSFFLCCSLWLTLTAKAQPVIKVAAGDYHSLFLKSDGSLWAMGFNGSGALGDGSFNNTNLPEQIVATGVTAISAGAYHSLFLKSDGSLWAMGNNLSGQLGDGTDNNSRALPEQIVASSVTAIAAGNYHSLFLKSDGSLWAMGGNDTGQLGDNTHGELGDGTTNSTPWPERVVPGGVTTIAAGYLHSLFLKNDGSLWAMGTSPFGELGDGTYAPVTDRPEQIVASGVNAMAAGAFHSLFLKSDGSLWAMGQDSYGQLGDGTFGQTNRPELIVAGPPGYNQVSLRLLSGGGAQLSFVGIPGANYALDRSFSLAPATWIPQATNPADDSGALVFTNAPETATNNFWRIRLVP